MEPVSSGVREVVDAKEGTVSSVEWFRFLFAAKLAEITCEPRVCLLGESHFLRDRWSRFNMVLVLLGQVGL